MTIVRNTVLYTWNLLRVDPKHFHHTHTHSMWGERYIN